MRNSLILLMLLSLAACADPLAKFERIEDVELAAEEPIAQALPDANDVNPTEGLLAGVLGRETATSSETADLGQGDTSDIDLAVAAVLKEDEEPRGVRGWLRRAAAAQSDATAEVEGVGEESVEVVEATTQGDVREDIAQDVVAAETTEIAPSVAGDDIADKPLEIAQVAEDEPVELVDPAKRRGLFGLLKPVEDAPETVRTASLDTSDVTPQPAPRALAEPKKRAGLFGGGARETTRIGPDAKDVAFGTVLPYGEVARVCDAKSKSSLGRRLDQAPAPGVGYSLYDSDPQSTGPRTFYVTGFRDNCPRQFTASLALFGSPKFHEQLRYGRPSKLYPYSTTDRAYEKVKSAICKVGKNKPCGAKMVSLERTTVFISTYENFSENARWADILMHDGTVLAAAIKAP